MVFFLAISGAYVTTWCLRRELGIVKPMANLRYFYYGSEPCTLSDSILFWAYSPLYKTSLALQTWRGDRVDVHWSDRGEGAEGYQHLCKDGRRLGV